MAIDITTLVGEKGAKELYRQVLADIKSTADTKAGVDELAQAIRNLERMVAEDYSDQVAYRKGKHVIHEHVLYECRDDMEGPEEWDGGHWKAVTIAELLEG